MNKILFLSGDLVIPKSKDHNFVLGSRGASWGEIHIKNHSEFFIVLYRDKTRWATETIKVLGLDGRTFWFFERDLQIITGDF